MVVGGSGKLCDGVMGMVGDGLLGGVLYGKLWRHSRVVCDRAGRYPAPAFELAFLGAFTVYLVHCWTICYSVLEPFLCQQPSIFSLLCSALSRLSCAGVALYIISSR